MRIDTLFDKAAAHNAAVETEEARLRETIERNKAELARLSRIRHADTAKAIASEVGTRMPDHRVVVLGPFGMTGELGLHVENDAGDIIASLTLEPDRNREGGLVVVEGIGRDAKRTPLSGTMDELVERLKDQAR